MDSKLQAVGPAKYFPTVIFLDLIIYFVQKFLEPPVLRITENFVGAALLGNKSVVHKYDLIGNFGGKAHLMGNDDHGAILLGKALYYLQNLARKLRVKGGGRFVKKRISGSRARALAIATRCC